MELSEPGVNTLNRVDITHEGEAERLARGTSGAARPWGATRAITSWRWEVAPVLARAMGRVAG
jgi:hypothetical protein